jgi:dTDP-4-amino-4,6-dideoxygalactose transaminase
MRLPKWPVHTDRELQLLQEVLESPMWGGFHEMVKRFETQFAAFQHCQFGIAAMNGTVTLETALAACGIGPGDEVIVPAISFISTATAVSRTGAEPVFVDIEPYSFNIDPERAAAAVTPRTRAIIPVHFGGPMADMDRLAALSSIRFPLIEDAAHAHGSEWNGRRAGGFGIAGSFSFQNGKVITSGEGGMLTTNDADFAEQLRAFINQGRSSTGASFFHHYTLGTNFRMTAFQAAVLIAQLERLPDQICLRERNERLLKQDLAGVEGLRFQEVPPAAGAHSHYLLPGRIDAKKFGMTRDEFHRALTAAGIPCTPFYPHPLYGNPLYREGGCRVEPCPNAEACVQDAFWFPHRVLMGDEETTHEIAAVIRGLHRSRS